MGPGQPMPGDPPSFREDGRGRGPEGYRRPGDPGEMNDLPIGGPVIFHRPQGHPGHQEGQGGSRRGSRSDEAFIAHLDMGGPLHGGGNGDDRHKGGMGEENPPDHSPMTLGGGYPAGSPMPGPAVQNLWRPEVPHQLASRRDRTSLPASLSGEARMELPKPEEGSLT
jgi:hypothetical protein